MQGGQRTPPAPWPRARQDSIRSLPDDPITRFFTGHPVGRAWRGASEAALGWIPNMVGGAGNALADVWDYATGTTRADSVLSPETASYRMRTPLMQTFADEGLSSALGQLVTDTVRGMPGISLIDTLSQPSRDWESVGSAALNTAARAARVEHSAHRLEVVRDENMSCSSGGDHLRDSLGAARINSVEEFEQIIDNLRRANVSISFRNDYAYGPAATPGRPGSIVFDYDGSISAIRHEYRHYLDDAALGFPSARFYYSNPHYRVASERRSYLEEIRLARGIGDYNARRSLILDYLRENNI